MTLDEAGGRVEVVGDDPAVTVVANPARDWRLISAAMKPGKGPFVKVTAPVFPVTQPERVLVPWVDWIQADLIREGGPLFVHPSVKLVPGEVLIAHHRAGSTTRIVITRHLATTAQRVARAAKQTTTPEVVTRFSRFRDDDE